MKRHLQLSGLVATGFFTFSPLCLGHGGSGGHSSGSGGQTRGQSHAHSYMDPFRYSGYYSRAGSYDSVPYAYTPSPEQQAAAQKHVAQYFTSIHKHRRPAATHRCIAVATLPPTKAQREDYLKKRAESKAKEVPSSTPSVTPGQLHCVMVFDIQTKQFVGSGCYVIEGLPPGGAVVKFETLSAEFVGQETL
jgi:hypothetical protein